jgi:hypothetical protein
MAVAACQPRYAEPLDVVTVQYDPNDYDQTEIGRAAQAQCEAKGFTYARPYFAQPNMDAAPWGYRTFACY